MTQHILDEVAKAPATPEPWIAAGYYPRLSGPGPGIAGPLAVMLANAALVLFSDQVGFVTINALLLALTLLVCFALQAPEEPILDKVNVLALFTVALAWTGTVIFFEDSFGVLAKHVMTTLNGLLLWLTYHLKAVRHSWWVAVHASDLWDAAGLSQYGAFLLSAKPGPGSARVARELYRVACGEYLKSGAPSSDASRAMTIYASMLQKGQGGRADRQQAKWWREKASEGQETPV